MSEPDPAEVNPCKNCGRALTGDFCGNCGQPIKDTLRPFILFVQELVFTVFELDGRAYKSLFFIYTKPGFLSSEYAKGRRASYTPPLRLFLVISIGFFLLVSLSTSILSIRDSVTGSTSSNEAGLNITFSDGNLEFASSDEGDERDERDDIEDLIAFVSEIELPFLSEDSNQSLSGFLVHQIEANYEEVLDDPADFFIGS